MQLKGRHVLGFAAVASAVVLVALTSTGVAIGARISKALSSRSVPVGLGHAVKPDNLEKQAQTTFRYTLANKMDEDGVFFHFCGGTPDMLPWATWYSDAALSKPLRGDPAHDGEISDTYGEATKFNWAECATSGLMFFEVAKNASITIYAPSDTMYLPSGKVWWVPKSLLGPGGPGRALAKGPDQMSSSEMTWCAQPHASTPFPPKCGDGAGGGCSASGAPGILNGDVSGVDGYSYGSTLVFTPDSPGQENLSAKCIAATGPVGVEAEQTKYGFYSITAQGKSYGTCSTTPCPAGDDSCHFCGEFSEDPSSPCMSDACLGQCPATIANNACGQHHCRKWHKNYDNYDIWVKKACPVRSRTRRVHTVRTHLSHAGMSAPAIYRQAAHSNPALARTRRARMVGPWVSWTVSTRRAAGVAPTSLPRARTSQALILGGIGSCTRAARRRTSRRTCRAQTGGRAARSASQRRPTPRSTTRQAR